MHETLWKLRDIHFDLKTTKANTVYFKGQNLKLNKVNILKVQAMKKQFVMITGPVCRGFVWQGESLRKEKIIGYQSNKSSSSILTLLHSSPPSVSTSETKNRKLDKKTQCSWELADSRKGQKIPISFSQLIPQSNKTKCTPTITLESYSEFSKCNRKPPKYISLVWFKSLE